MGMLVLTRRQGEEILIGEHIRIVVTHIEAGKVRIGVDAPRDIPVYRKELLGLGKPPVPGDAAGPIE